MPISHVLYGAIEDSVGSSSRPSSSQDPAEVRQQVSKPSPRDGVKERNLRKLQNRKLNIRPEDILQMDSEPPSQQTSIEPNSLDVGSVGETQPAAERLLIPEPKLGSDIGSADDDESDGSFSQGPSGIVDLPSIGSSAHAAGECRVCMFAHSKTGCMKGASCRFCHLPHKRPRRNNKMRPCKGKRERYRKLVGYIEKQIQTGPESFNINDVVLPPSVAQNEAAKAKFMAKVAGFLEQMLADRRAGEDDEDDEAHLNDLIAMAAGDACKYA